MPEGSKYTPSELMLLREEGILSPSEILTLQRTGASENSSSSRVLSQIRSTRGAKGGTRRSRSQGYRYFPDN